MEEERLDEDEDTTAEKFTALAQTMGACAVASVDLVSALLIQSTKAIVSFVSTTYQENVQENKRRRINTEASIVNKPTTTRRQIPAAELFPDPNQAPRSVNRGLDIKNLVASPARMGTLNWIHDTPTTKKPLALDAFAHNFASPNLLTPSKASPMTMRGTPMDINTTLSTPGKQVISQIPDPKTYKPAVTPSFNPNATVNSIIPDSPLAVQPTLKVKKLIDGLRRHRIGVLSREAVRNSPPFSRQSSIHGGGNTPSKEIPHEAVFGSPKIARAFRFNDRRFDGVQALRYPQPFRYTPRKVELPEQAISTDVYHSLYMDVVAQRKKMDKYLDDIRKADEEEKAKKEAKERVPLLDQQAVQEVEQMWQRRNRDAQVVMAYRVEIKVYDLCTLRDGQWLNDNIIDFYLAMISERSTNSKLPSCFAFSTHFFSTLQTRGYAGVARWAKRKGIDVTKLDFIFVPINRHNTHWCLAVINNRDMRFEFYDSMNGAGANALDILREYMYLQTQATYPGLSEEDMGYDKYGMFSALPCPQQQNSYDCGVFVSKMVEVLSRDKDVMSFSQDDMPTIRRRMVYEIMNNKLL